MKDLRARSLLSLGVLTGAALGLLGGIAEAALRPLAEPLRVPYVIGFDGLLGAGWGLAVALVNLPRRRSPARAVASILSVVAMPAFVAALGLFANRVLLTGSNFLGRISLVADAAAVAVSFLLALVLARGARRIVASRGAAPAPHPAVAALAVVLLAAGVMVPARRVAQRAGGPARPPVIVVSIDTLRPDRLSGGGEPLPTSPEIDRLCREGTLWPEAVTASPGSAASHAALLTSRYPVSNGVWANFSVMDGSVETLAERLHEAGYRTGGFATNTFLGRRFGFAQGFDSYVESGTTERLVEPSGAALFRSLAVVQIVDKIRYALDTGHDPSFEAALAWLRESDRPPFLFLHFMDVHSPYVPPSPWGDRFGATADGGPESPDHRNKFGWRPSVAAYVAEIRHTDTKVGRLRRELERLGWLDRCVLLITSDHGENLVDHRPNFTHGSTLFESTLRVLAALRAPGTVPAGVLDARVFENVDALPTLADVAAFDPSPDWEGRSFARAAVPASDVTFGQLDRSFAVRSKTWKVVVREDGGRALYRLDTDPGETAEAPPDAERFARAEEALALWMRRHSTSLYTEQARSVRPDELSPETRDKLRALGYLD